MGAGLDLLRFAGPGYAWRRWRDQAAWARRTGMAAAVYEEIWRDAAKELGADLIDLSEGFFEIRRGKAHTRVWLHWVMLDDIVSVRLALDKAIVNRLLAETDIPVPEHREFEFRDLSPACELLERTDQPWVIKPASGTSGGEGITSGVRTPRDLERAALRASRGDTRLQIERQIPGDAYRLLFCDGKLLDVIRRKRPSVVGDGSSSISELIRAENRRRIAARGRRGLRILTVDLDCALTLGREGLRPSSVPGKGEDVVLKGVVSQNGAHQNETVTEPLANELIGEAAAAVDCLGLRLAGVDLNTPDLSRSLRDAGGAIVEVNGTPGLHYHYQVADAENATRVALPILSRLLESGHRDGDGAS